MNTFAIGSLPVHFSVAKLFTFRWQYTPINIMVTVILGVFALAYGLFTLYLRIFKQQRA